MQNRYAGDVGDFGKLGLLRQLTSTQLKIGVNWYLAPNESHNDDGKHIAYISDEKYKGCDDALRNSLGEILNSQRSVSALEIMDLVPNAVYYHDELCSPSSTPSRCDWNIKALEALSSADIVFLDPDNGLLVKSVSPRSTKSNKYVLSNEITDYFAAG